MMPETSLPSMITGSSKSVLDNNPPSNDSDKLPHVDSESLPHATSLLEDKYDRLMEQYATLQTTNSDLEDRLLNVIEKTEREKILLSEEIDELSARLTKTSNTIVGLENECVPLNLRSRLGLPVDEDELEREQSSDSLINKKADSPKKIVHVPSHSTFPPMAIYYDMEEAQKTAETEEQAAAATTLESIVVTGGVVGRNESSELQPEDPAHPSTSNSGGPSHHESSAQAVLVDRLKSIPDYQTPEIRQCRQCGTIVSCIEKSMQTEPRPPVVSGGGHPPPANLSVGNLMVRMDKDWPVSGGEHQQHGQRSFTAVSADAEYRDDQDHAEYRDQLSPPIHLPHDGTIRDSRRTMSGSSQMSLDTPI